MAEIQEEESQIQPKLYQIICQKHGQFIFPQDQLAEWEDAKKFGMEIRTAECPKCGNTIAATPLEPKKNG